MEEVNRTQELIRNMNEEFSKENDVTKQPPAVEQPTLPADETQQPPPDNQPPKAQPTKQQQQPKPTPKGPGGDDKFNSDPLFLKKPEGDQSNQNQQQQQPVVEEEIPVEKVYAHLSKMTNGAVKDEKGWIGFVNSYNQLVEEAQKGWQPKFQDDRAQRIFQYLSASTGSETAAAMRLLRTLDYKPDGKNAKDVLFQAYLQDPKNSDLTELTAKDYFEAEYETKYELLNKPDEELTEPQRRAKIAMQREQQLAVRDAMASIKKVQDEFATADAGPKQVDKTVTDAITKAVGGFPGLKLAFTDNPQETEFMNVPFNDPVAKQQLLEEILNPDEAYNSMVEEFRKDDGNMDWDALARESYERKHHKEIRKQVFEHGLAQGELRQINKIKNASGPRDISKTNGVPGAGAELSFNETWLNAKNNKGQ